MNEVGLKFAFCYLWSKPVKNHNDALPNAPVAGTAAFDQYFHLRFRTLFCTHCFGIKAHRYASSFLTLSRQINMFHGNTRKNTRHYALA